MDNDECAAKRTSRCAVGSTVARPIGNDRAGAGVLGVVRHLWHTLPLDRFTAAADPASHLKETTLKKDLHPTYVETQVTCTCGNTFTTRSTAKNGVIHADVCSQCHPFYTGKQKILDTGGRVARFEARYGKKAAK